jgi:hypothetical protein
MSKKLLKIKMIEETPLPSGQVVSKGETIEVDEETAKHLTREIKIGPSFSGTRMINEASYATRKLAELV